VFLINSTVSWKTRAASEADETLSACFASLCLQFAALALLLLHIYSPRESGRDNPSVIKLQFLGRKLSSKVVKLVNIILAAKMCGYASSLKLCLIFCCGCMKLISARAGKNEAKRTLKALLISKTHLPQSK
jgi:hypothetical protein